MTNDATREQRTEAALRESEERFRNLAEMLPAMVCELDVNGIITFASKQAFEISGYSDEDFRKGITAENLFAPQDLARAMINMKRIAAGEVLGPQQYTAITKYGKQYPIYTNTSVIRKEGKPVGFRSVVFDITERRQMEEAVTTAQKLESLGVLAGGIAHDFNNLLGGIYGNIEIAQEHCPHPKSAQALSKALSTIDRAKGLTQELITFAKGGEPVRSPGHLFPFVQDIAHAVVRTSPITIDFRVNPGLLMSNFDKAKVSLLVDHLIRNAVQAMPRGGTIVLSAANVTLGENAVNGLPAGPYIFISIKDTGVGIAPEILPKIFDPFFTTKGTSRGLGLSICYSIVKHHGGQITVTSVPGEGSTFGVYFPALTDAVITPPVIAPQQLSKHSGAGRILLMDDDDMIMETVTDMLHGFGYSVLAAQNGKQALSIVWQGIASGDNLTAIILDLTVPGGLGGRETVKDIRRLDKHIPIFVASGYCDDPVMKNPAQYGFTASICKPFRKSDLAQMLDQYLKK